MCSGECAERTHGQAAESRWQRETKTGARQNENLTISNPPGGENHRIVIAGTDLQDHQLQTEHHHTNKP